jgi:arsenite-transporting ATPase
MWRNVAGAAAGEARPDDPVLEALEERRARFARAREALTDPARAAFVFVVTPERLPILETERATRILERYRIPVGAVVVNRVLPAAAEGPFAERRRDEEAGHLDDIRRRFAAHALLGVPQLPRDVQGMDDLRRLWEALRRALPR